jgi:hypothetical protein
VMAAVGRVEGVLLILDEVQSRYAAPAGKAI